MKTRSVYYSALLLLALFLYQKDTQQSIITCSTLVYRGSRLVYENVSYNYSDLKTKNNLSKLCHVAHAVLLEGESSITADGIDNRTDFFHWILSTLHIYACLEIEDTSFSTIELNIAEIKGTCEGAQLKIFNNRHAETVIFWPDLYDTFTSTVESTGRQAIQIRGNKKLREIKLNDYYHSTKYSITSKRGYLKVCDCQTFPECSLPKPFKSLKTLDPSCKGYWGSLTLEQGETQIPYDSSDTYNFTIEGCIQIENTEIKDISFLYVFTNIRSMLNCVHFVRNNKKLCVNNFEYLSQFFENINIQFSNNSDQPCDGCVGGRVSKYYLEKSTNCTTFYGDLIIENFRGLPSNFGKLRGVEAIYGRLIIRNNTGLKKFDYFATLKKVGRYRDDVAIVVKDNADLTIFPLPNLQDIKLRKEEQRVELANNPVLVDDLEETTATDIDPTNEEDYEDDYVDTPTVTDDYADTSKFGDSSVSSVTLDAKEKLIGSDAKGKTSSRTDKQEKIMMVVGGAVATIILILLCALAVFFVRPRKKSMLLSSEPKFKLSKKSQQKLASLCEEILAGNPMTWFTEDLKILWKQIHGGTIQNVASSSNYAEFVKKEMIPVTNNGRILQRKNQARFKSLQRRILELLQYDFVITIGDKNDVTEVVSCLPKEIGDISAYEDAESKVAVTFKLLKVTHLPSKLTLYNYEAKDVNKNTLKNIELLLYQWPTERLPTDFTELLHLLTASRGRKAICTSNRRKEVFSMLYLLYGCILEGKGPQSVAEIFQLHSQFCNGAPLDRHEMLYIMRTLLYMASAAKCLSSEDMKKDAEWCQIYDRMAAFSRKYRNIMSIHPQHLGHFEFYEDVKCGVEAARMKTIDLSERPFLPMTDRYRMKTADEIKREVNEAIKSTYRNVVKSIEVSPSSDISSWSKSSASSNAEKSAFWKVEKSIKVPPISDISSWSKISTSSNIEQEKDKSIFSTITK